MLAPFQCNCFGIISHLNGIDFLEHFQWQPRGQAIAPLNFHLLSVDCLLLVMTAIVLLILIGNLNCVVILLVVNNLLKNLKQISLTIDATQMVPLKNLSDFITLGIKWWDANFVANKIVISITLLSKDLGHHITALMWQDDFGTDQRVKILAIHMVVKVFILWQATFWDQDE